MPSYPVTVRPRRPYDSDGTLVRTVTGVTPSVPSGADIGELNGSSATGGIAVGAADWLAVVFPSLITLDALFVAHAAASNLAGVAVQISADTTNGGDGAWVPAGTTIAYRGDQVASTATWRANLTTGLSLYCKGLRIGPVTTAWRTLHLHGGGPGEDPEGLIIRSSAYAALPGGTVDWGVSPRGSSADRQVVVANTSTLAAQGVVLSVEAAEDSAGFAIQHYLSLDGRNFTATVDLGSIAGGSRSASVTVRRVTPSTATTGARAARLAATATTWV